MFDCTFPPVRDAAYFRKIIQNKYEMNNSKINLYV